MRILAIFDYYIPHIGGAEVVYKHVLEGLSAREHDVTLLTLSLPDTKEQETLHRVSVNRVKSHLGRMFFPFFGLWKAWKLSRNGDIIVTSFYSASVLTFLLKILTGKKVVMIVHEVLDKRWHTLRFSWIRSAFLRLSERIALPTFYDGYIAVSNSTAKNLYAIVKKDRIYTVYNGVDHESFSPQGRNEELRKQLGIERDQKVFMYAGRPGYVKGINTLLEAIPEVIQSIEHAVFVLMLSTSPEEKYKEITEFWRTSPFKERIKIIPPVPRDQVPSYFAIADIAVVPSLTEGFGFLAAEFASMQIPLVASRVDSLPEVISGKVAFALPGNTTSLVDAMKRADQGIFEILPEKRFSWEDTVVEYERILQKLL